MKNVMYLLGLILCFTSISLSAQIVKLPNQISTVGGKGGEPFELVVYLNQNCEFVQTITVEVTNLDYLNEDICAEFLGLPEGYDDLYVRCWINGHYFERQITTFEVVDCIETESPISVYSYSFQATVSFYDECESTGGEGAFNLSVNTQLATKVGTLWEDYPVCNHMGTGDIFDCDYFFSSESECNNSSCNNYGASRHGYSHDLLQCGSACTDILPAIPHKDPDEKGEIPPGGGNPQMRQMPTEFSLTVNPNPFTTEVIINWQNTVEDGSMRVMDTSGRVIESWSSADAGTLNWDTSNLPRGMYILEVKDGAERKFMKLIKS